MSLFQTLMILAAIFILFFLYCWSKYNLFIKSRNQLKTDFSDIDIQLKRRASMVADLADLVKSYATHEKDTFENVTKARSAIDSSKNASEAAEADNFLTKAVRSLYVVSENYPELKANQSFQELMNDIKQSENAIASYREEYNRSVQTYNDYVQTFPGLMVAELFRFQPAELFQAK